MGTKIDSDTLLFSIYRFCRRCNEMAHGVGYDSEPCHNDLCPMKFVVNEIGEMQVKERVTETNNNEQGTSSKRRCPSCGSYWLSAEYCCNCGAKTVENEPGD